jgi:hypothetical protein
LNKKKRSHFRSVIAQKSVLVRKGKMTAKVNQQKFFSVLELDCLEMLHADNVLAASPRHTHETFTLGIIDQGTAFLHHKGNNYSISADCLIAIAPDDVHACHTRHPLGYSQRIIYPSVALLEQATYEATGGRSH